MPQPAGANGETAALMHERSPLAALFSPRGIAVLGASGREGNLFARPLRFLVEHGYEGGIYPVNPNYDTLHGIPCYPALEALPHPVDLVLMMVSAEEAVRQIPSVAASGATAAVAFASGFAEVGPQGLMLQTELAAAARQYGVRLLGPNCQGVVSVPHRMAGTFTAAVESGLPRNGNVAYVGQSGAIGGSILSLAQERGLGISAWASTGNQADLDALDLGAYLIEDERIRVLAMYLESTVDGTRYGELARRAQELGKSILVLQSARSLAGRRAAASHTGAIIGENAAFLAMSRELGVIQADDFEDFIALTQALSVLPRAAGSRLAIVTTSGGAGSLAADQAEHAGLVVEPLTDTTQHALAALVPDFGAVANPVDVTAQLFRSDSHAFIKVCELVLADPTVDVVLVTLTMVIGEMAEQMAADLDAVWRAATKPMIVVWFTAREQTLKARAMLREEGWPVLDSPRTGMHVLRGLATRQAALPLHRENAPGEAVVTALAALAGPVVTEGEAAGLLLALGVAQPQQRVVRSAQEAQEAARILNGPLVMKIQSPNIIHKTERGGVRLDIAPSDVGRVYEDLVRAFADDDVDGVLVQEQAGIGPELIIGVTNSEASFPALVTVGIGGIAAELYRDTTTRIAPVDEAGAIAMLLELRAAPLLTGMRGLPEVELSSAARVVARLSSVAGALGDRLVELEVNPLRLTDQGRTPLALDFFLRVVEQSTGATAVPALNPDKEQPTP